MRAKVPLEIDDPHCCNSNQTVSQSINIVISIKKYAAKTKVKIEKRATNSMIERTVTRYKRYRYRYSYRY